MSDHREARPFGQRPQTITVDAMLLGFGRRLLLEQTDPETARDMMMRVGRAQGWRLAGRQGAHVPGLEDAWQAASRAATSIGLGHARPSPAFRAGALEWEDSAEALHHRLSGEGTSTVPVCWFLTGFFAGYLSRVHVRVACVEERCAAQGSATCVFVGASAARQRFVHMREPLPDDTDPAPDDDPGLGVRSAHMRVLVSQAARVAGVNSTVLITGESGVGKNRLARFIHDRSERARRAFLPLNCAALSDTLLESELFGHKRGAFTGADQDHVGLFETAAGGTLFLDEIGDVSTALQIKLLAVLQDRQLRRVGETHYRRIDVRVIAATNRDLEREVRAGRFRADFYYRLAVICLRVPPLRERPEDLQLLLRRILTQKAQGLNRPITDYTPRALRALLRYRWPGNIRELDNAIEAACASATGSAIDLGDLPAAVREQGGGLGQERPETLRAVRRAHILRVLGACHNNKRLAAQRLGISITTLRRELQGTDDEALEQDTDNSRDDS